MPNTSAAIIVALTAAALSLASLPAPTQAFPSSPFSAVLLSAGITRRKVLASLGGIVLSLPISGEVYSRLGSNNEALSSISNSLFADLNEDVVEDVTLVFHGAAGTDQYTDELMAALSKTRGSGKRSYQTMVEWSDLSSNILQASFSGLRLGKSVAQQLLSKCDGDTTTTTSGDGQIRRKLSVHLIGISVGAFAANECCNEIKRVCGDDVYVQLTLLDPFQQRGVLGTGYGFKNFGKMADYAQHYLNTDDPVPSTNAPLTKYCHVADVTQLRPDGIFGHDWPLVYYSRSGSVGIVPTEDRLAPGTLDVVEK